MIQGCVLVLLLLAITFCLLPPVSASFCEQEKREVQELRKSLQKEAFYSSHIEWSRSTGFGHSFAELFKLPSNNSVVNSTITIVLNHYQRSSICRQLQAVLSQTANIQIMEIWLCIFGSPLESEIANAAATFKDTRIKIIHSQRNFKYYGRFQMALQAPSDFVWVLDDDIIPGSRHLEILLRIMSTYQYRGLLGSMGWLLPVAFENSYMPSYRHKLSKSLYFPDPAYGIRSTHILEADFLCSTWFGATSWFHTLFSEAVPTWATGEDMMLSSRLRMKLNISSFVVPTDLSDLSIWGDTDHRLAADNPTTLNSIFNTRDTIWKKNILAGDLPLWSRKNVELWSATSGKAIIYIEDGNMTLDFGSLFQQPQWWFAVVVCRNCEILLPLLKKQGYPIGQESCSQADYFGLFRMCTDVEVRALAYRLGSHAVIHVTDLQIPRRDPRIQGVPYAVLNSPPNLTRIQWLTHFTGAQFAAKWHEFRIVLHVITMNRVASLDRLCRSLSCAYYMGDNVDIHFHLDSPADEATLNYSAQFRWTHGQKFIHHRVVRGGLISALVESYYPADNQEYAILLEDDVEVSAQFYSWARFGALWSSVNAADLPGLMGISLYTPRLIEVRLPRKPWNSYEFFQNQALPYLHQLPCSWGALYFPGEWRKFHTYLQLQLENETKVHILKSATNGWKASWKKFLIEFMLLGGHYLLYPGYKNQTSFSTNHLEPGEHIGSLTQKLQHFPIDFTVPLHKDTMDWLFQLPLDQLSTGRKIPRLDLFNNKITEEQIHTNAQELQLLLIDPRLLRIFVQN